MANKNIRSLSFRKEFEPNLFESISDLASKNGADKQFKNLAQEFLLGEAVVFGTSSFYDFTKEENRLKKIHICNGSACLTSRTQNKLLQEVKNYFSEEEIGHVSCLGHCHSNASLMYKGQTYSIQNDDELNQILTQKSVSNNSYYIGNDSNQVLTGSAIENLKDFFGLLNSYYNQPQSIISELKNSNLRGRGGAGFPFWFKLDSVSKENNYQQKYIVCNADEGDPGAYSDMYLLEKQPYKVLFGMYTAGIAVGADTGVLYIRGEYPSAINTIIKAIQLLDNQNITPQFKWKVIEGQGAYICGEETALLNSIEGLRPEVRVRPPYPTNYGLFGKPTVLSNVETFANIHWILENSGLEYSKIGTIKSSGTKLISLDSHFVRPGIYEITMGTPLSAVIEQFGLGFNKSIKAVQIGGPLGGIVPVSKLTELTLDFESFQDQGFLLGHASFVCIPTDFPMIHYLRHLWRFVADESCGKCFPCRIGSQRGYELIDKAIHENYKIDHQLFNDLLATLASGSLCALGGGIPLPIQNALDYFEAELKDYFTNI